MVRVLAGVLPLGIGASFAWHVRRDAFLVDDAYISFRYAANWAHGLGPVWNPAERIEGYTNFLWVALIAVGIRLGAAPEQVALGLGVASGVGVLLAVAAYQARRTGWSDPWIWAAPALLTWTRMFVAWSTGGLETMGYTLATVGGLLLLAAGRFGLGGWVLAAGALTRPEGVLVVAIGAVYVAWVGDRRAWLRYAAPAVVLVGAHLAFRLAYYGDWVPNTLHAKVDGPAFHQAARYFALLHHDTWLGYAAPLIAIPALVRRSPPDVLFAVVIGLHCLYLGWIGGDIFEFRMIVPVLPLAAVASADAVRWLAGTTRVGTGVAWVGLAAACVGQDALAARTASAPVRAGIASIGSMRAYTGKRVRAGRALARLHDQGLLPADVRIATAGAGAMPFVSGLYTVDVLGLNDATVARTEPLPNTRPGHRKHASRGYLSERGVDMLDIAGGFVFAGRTPGRAELSRANRRLRRFNQTEGDVRLRLRCRRVPGGHLLFASPLDDEAFEARFGHLPSCGATG